MKSKTHIRQRKRIISTFCALAMIIMLLPTMIPQKVNAETIYTGNIAPLTLNSGTYTLSNVTIASTHNKAGIEIQGNVTLIIKGTNNISGGNADFYMNDKDRHDQYSSKAGIHVPSSSTLIIQGNGTLNATGGKAGNGFDGFYLDGKGYYDNNSGLIGGGGASAGIGGNGGIIFANAESAGKIHIQETVSVRATGGNGGNGGAAVKSKENATYASGGGGYPAAGIGGGGGAGGSASYAGGGGYSGGSAVGYQSSNVAGGINGLGGTGSYFDSNKTQILAGGGGYFSKGTDATSQNTYGGALGGGGGKHNISTTPEQGSKFGANGYAGGKSGEIIIASTANVTPVNGGDPVHGSITFNRGANQPVKGIGSGAGYTEPTSGTYTVASVPSTPLALKVEPGNGQNKISWAAPAANGAAITNYEVFQDGVSIGTTILTSMTKTKLTNGINYSYSVRAYNAAGWGAQSPSVNAVPFGLPDR